MWDEHEVDHGVGHCQDSSLCCRASTRYCIQSYEMREEIVSVHTGVCGESCGDVEKFEPFISGSVQQEILG